MTESTIDPHVAEAQGQQLFSQEKFTEAAEQFTLAQQAYAGTGAELKAAEMLNNLGVIKRRVRKHQEAADALEQASQIFERYSDHSRQAQVLGNLGGLYSKMKRYDKSEACFQAAINLFQELDDRPRQSETLRAMAIMQFKRGQRSKAFVTYEDALYFLPNANLLQRFTRFILKLRGLILRLNPFK